MIGIKEQDLRVLGRGDDPIHRPCEWLDASMYRVINSSGSTAKVSVGPVEPGQPTRESTRKVEIIPETPNGRGVIAGRRQIGLDKPQASVASARVTGSASSGPAARNAQGRL